MNHKEKLDYDEESLKEKVKKRAGIFALVGSGLISILHTLSHIIPAIGIIGLSFAESNKTIYNFLSNEYTQLAYLPFVGLGFYYMYRDHQHHKHERGLRKKLQKTEEKLRNLKKKL